MKIFVAGATGVIGIPLVRRLAADGHQVTGMTRTPSKAASLRELGVEPVVCDVYDAASLKATVVGSAPDVLIHELTRGASLVKCSCERKKGPRVGHRRDQVVGPLAVAISVGSIPPATISEPHLPAASRTTRMVALTRISAGQRDSSTTVGSPSRHRCAGPCVTRFPAIARHTGPWAALRSTN